jgi:predicted phosphodiesterase
MGSVRRKWIGVKDIVSPVVDIAAAQKERIESLEEGESLLRQQVEALTAHFYTIEHNYDGDKIRFGVVGDTHRASNYENTRLLEAAYRRFEQEGIQKVYHQGDVVDGRYKNRAGNEYEIKFHSADDQSDYVIRDYPKVDGITTYVIAGSHDWTHFKNGGHDVCRRISEHREDIEYQKDVISGYYSERDYKVSCDTGETILRSVHPGGGTAYALSYSPQKYVESLTPGHKPGLLMLGHYHKMEFFCYRNVHVFQVGCMQFQTPWMREHKLMAVQGFWMIELTVNEIGIVECSPRWFPDYN